MSLVKTVLVLAVIGLVLFDGVAVMVNHVQTDDLAGRALRAAERTSGSTSAARQTSAQEAAEQAVAEHRRATVEEVATAGGTLAVTVTQTAPVIWLDRVGPLEDWAVSTVTKESNVP